jgi:hypothetical protein
MRLRFWHAIARIFGFASGYLGVVSDWGWDHYNAIRYPAPVYVAPPPPPERIIIPSDTPLPETPIVVEGSVLTSFVQAERQTAICTCPEMWDGDGHYPGCAQFPGWGPETD